MSISPAALKTGDRVKVTRPRQPNDDLFEQTLEVARINTQDAFSAYLNDPAADWEAIKAGEKVCRPTRSLYTNEVEWVAHPSAFRPRAPELKFRPGDRVMEDSNSDHWLPEHRLDCLVRHGTFIDYRPMAGCGDHLYCLVTWDDEGEGYALESALTHSAIADSRPPGPPIYRQPALLPEVESYEIHAYEVDGAAPAPLPPKPPFKAGDRVQTDYTKHNRKANPLGLSGVIEGTVGVIQKVELHHDQYFECWVKFEGQASEIAVSPQFLIFVCPLLSGFKAGDRVQFSGIAGTIEVDQSGVWIREDGAGRMLLNRGALKILKKLPPEHKARKQAQAKGKRRPASGWIETREGNQQRKTPSISHYYCFEQQGKRTRKYIPAAKVATVQQLVSDRRPIAEILEVL
ncbi:hypothetical protein [Halomicronema sp. CCY15110]|uniref:hypothetical protein n=1 Tax=Halomicronema sp. CCY15110 TaxID=2767773 RepID=UPI001950592E|nr:hypothetical protein [Halomicronema sp. CCY15110]